MPQYALAFVPPDWDNEAPLMFSQAQYDTIHENVVAGTEIILFMAEPANEVIGQAQTPGPFIKTSEWPQQNLHNIDASDPAQAYLLPLNVLFLLRGPHAPVPLARVREALRDPNFPQPGEYWRRLDADEYDALRDGWT